MTRLGNVVQQFLDLNDWSDVIEDNEDKGSSLLRTCLEVDGQSCRLIVDTFEKTESIGVYLYPPFRMNLANYAEACMLVNAINYQLRVARFEIDPADGEVRLLVAVDLHGAEVGGAFVDGMVGAASWTLQRWLVALAAVGVAGRKASEVLEADKQEREEEAATGGAHTALPSPVIGAGSGLPH